MKHLQAYFFRQILWPFIVALAALTGLAILTQSLASISLLVEEQRGLYIFVYVTVLAMPQLLSLVIPIALFISVTYALHRLHTESERIKARKKQLKLDAKKAAKAGSSVAARRKWGTAA